MKLETRNIKIASGILDATLKYKSPETYQHVKRTSLITDIFVRHLITKAKYRSALTEQDHVSITVAAGLHDIGKVGVTDIILDKPGRLTAEELETMKQHVLTGKKIIDDLLDSRDFDGDFVRHCRDVTLYHHENFDGSGYFYGLEGENIPLSARIVAITDTYEALTSRRCYREAFTHGESILSIIENKGIRFDPDLANCFVEVADEFCGLKIIKQA